MSGTESVDTRQREQEETSCNQAEREKTREDWSGEKLKKNVRREGQREDTRLKVDYSLLVCFCACT